LGFGDRRLFRSNFLDGTEKNTATIEAAVHSKLQSKRN